MGWGDSFGGWGGSDTTTASYDSGLGSFDAFSDRSYDFSDAGNSGYNAGSFGGGRDGGDWNGSLSDAGRAFGLGANADDTGYGYTERARPSAQQQRSMQDAAVEVGNKVAGPFGAHHERLASGEIHSQNFLERRFDDLVGYATLGLLDPNIGSTWKGGWGAEPTGHPLRTAATLAGMAAAGPIGLAAGRYALGTGSSIATAGRVAQAGATGTAFGASYLGGKADNAFSANLGSYRTGSGFNPDFSFNIDDDFLSGTPGGLSLSSPDSANTFAPNRPSLSGGGSPSTGGSLPSSSGYAPPSTFAPAAGVSYLSSLRDRDSGSVVFGADPNPFRFDR